MKVQATIERRLLVNYRVDPRHVAPLVPSPFRPTLVDGHAIAGICLIRLGHVRPAGFPAAVGMTSENAAHRIAVEWDTPDGPVQGVYIPRRDTSSRWVAALGGRLFPGWHHRARFTVDEGNDAYRIAFRSLDDDVRVDVTACAADRVMAGSLFPDTDAASHFFRAAPTAYTAARRPGSVDGVALDTCGWALRPLAVEAVESSFFERLPGITLDSAFLMQDLASTWTAIDNRPGPRDIQRVS